MQKFSNVKHTSITQKSCHRHRAKCRKLNVKAKVTSDTLKSLIINHLGVTLSLEKFFNSELTSVNTNIRGKE